MFTRRVKVTSIDPLNTFAVTVFCFYILEIACLFLLPITWVLEQARPSSSFFPPLRQLDSSLLFSVAVEAFLRPLFLGLAAMLGCVIYNLVGSRLIQIEMRLEESERDRLEASVPGTSFADKN